MYKFYDTSSLLLITDKIIETKDPIVISSITLQELENIKNNRNTNPDLQYRARKLLHLIDEFPGLCEVWIFCQNMLVPIEEKSLIINNDTMILATAIDYDNTCHPDDVMFITNDLALKYIANLFFGEDSITSINENDDLDEYTGFFTTILSDEEMSNFYQNPTINSFNIHTNEYIVIKNLDKQIVDVQCWTGTEFRPLAYKPFKSRWFGDVKPYKGDIYQAMFADSLMNNKITMVKGPAGSGKTFLSLGYLMYLRERGTIDKIIVFCNTLATKNSAKLGYYPGTKDEKLLDSQIGNLLISKIGDRLMVEDMINKGQLILLPLSDIRGYDTSGMNAGVYISEAQNMDISLMKLALQRIGDDSICIIDGDCKTQVDDISFAGANNGMKRASQVFRGTNIYGEIELQNIHRSQIAQIAEDM